MLMFQCFVHDDLHAKLFSAILAQGQDKKSWCQCSVVSQVSGATCYY